MKKLLCIILATVMALAATSCAGSAPSTPPPAPAQAKADQQPPAEPIKADKPVIGFILGDLINEFYMQMMESGDQAAEDYGVEVIWQSCDASVEKEVSLIENFVLQGVDCIVLDPMDAEGVVSAIDAATAAGIPVITCANKIMGKDNYCTLYTDRENIAKSTSALCYALGGEGDIGLLSGNAGSWVVGQRELGFKDALEAFPNMKGDIQLTNLDPAMATTITENWINTNPNLKGIVSISDLYVLASVTAAESLNAKDKLVWGSNDGNVENYEYIESGIQLIDQLTGGYRVGYWNVATAARILKGEEIPKDIYLKCHTIMSDNTATMLKEKGFETEYITPKVARDVAVNCSKEFGPTVSDKDFVG